MRNPLYELEDVADELDELGTDGMKFSHRITECVDALRAKLEGAADLVADAGTIHNTSHAKREWVEGR